jgi:Mg2+/citrate symporter
MGIAIIVIMAVGVVLILTGKVPTAFALILIAIAIALVAGAPVRRAHQQCAQHRASRRIHKARLDHDRDPVRFVARIPDA